MSGRGDARPRFAAARWVAVALLTAAIVGSAVVGSALELGQDRLWLLVWWIYAPPVTFVAWLFAPVRGVARRVGVAGLAAAAMFVIVRWIPAAVDTVLQR